jgi:hypothetical protein
MMLIADQSSLQLQQRRRQDRSETGKARFPDLVTLPGLDFAIPLVIYPFNRTMKIARFP